MGLVGIGLGFVLILHCRWLMTRVDQLLARSLQPEHMETHPLSYYMSPRL